MIVDTIEGFTPIEMLQHRPGTIFRDMSAVKGDFKYYRYLGVTHDGMIVYEGIETPVEWKIDMPTTSKIWNDLKDLFWSKGDKK